MWYIQWSSLLLYSISCFKSTNHSPLSWSQRPYVGDELHFELHIAKRKSHSNHGKCTCKADSWALTSESWQGDRASAFSQIHQEILMHLWGGSHFEELCSRTSVYGRLCESRNDGSFSHVNHDVGSAFHSHAPDRAAGFGRQGAWGADFCPFCWQLSDEGIWLLYSHVDHDGILVSKGKAWGTHSAGANDGRCGKSGTCSPRGSFPARAAPRGVIGSSGVWFGRQRFPNLSKSRFALPRKPYSGVWS